MITAFTDRFSHLYPKQTVPPNNIPVVKPSFFAAKTQSLFTFNDRIKYKLVVIREHRALTFKNVLIAIFAYIFCKEIVEDVAHTMDPLDGYKHPNKAKLSQELKFYRQTRLIQKTYAQFIKQPSKETFRRLSEQFEILHSLECSQLLSNNDDQHREINDFLNKQVGGNVAQTLLEFMATQALSPENALTETSFKTFYSAENYLSLLNYKTRNGYGTKEEISNFFTTVFNKIFNEDPEKNHSICRNALSQYGSEDNFVDDYVKNFHKKFKDLMHMQKIIPNFNCETIHIPGISSEELNNWVKTYEDYIVANENYKDCEQNFKGPNKSSSLSKIKETEERLEKARASLEAANSKCDELVSKYNREIPEFARKEYSQSTIFMKYILGTTLSNKEIYEIDAHNENNELLGGVYKTKEEFFSIISSNKSWGEQ